MLISLTVGLTAYGQIDIKNTLGISVYMDGVHISNHNDVANATEKILNLRRQYPNAHIEGLSRGRLWAETSDDFFSSLSDTIELVEYVYKHELPTETYLDTIMDITYLTSGIDSLNNHTIFGVTKNGKAVSFKLKDTLGLHMNSLHGKPRFESFKMNVRLPRHLYSDRKYTFSDGELNEMFFRELLHVVRFKDSIKMTTQTYYNKPWWFAKKEANNLDDLKTVERTPFAYKPGNPHPNSWRHTQSWTMKYNKVFAKDTVSGEIKEGEMFINDMIKSSLKLTDLRIDQTSSGMPRVRVTGTEPCQMKLYAMNVNSIGSWILINHEQSYDYSSHGMNADWLVSGEVYHLMAEGRDQKGLDVIIMAQNITAP